MATVVGRHLAVASLWLLLTLSLPDPVFCSEGKVDHDHSHGHGHDHGHEEGEEEEGHGHDHDHSHGHKDSMSKPGDRHDRKEHVHAHDHDHGHGDGHGHGDVHGHEQKHGHGEGHSHEHGHSHHGHDVHTRGHSEEAGAAWALDDHTRWLWAYASALGMSAVSFVGVALLVLLNIPKLGNIVEYSCLAFAGTVLVADALLHLLPHALEGADHEAMTYVGLCAVAGCMAILAVPEALEWHSHGDSHGHDHDAKVQAYGYANLVTEMLHNFVDGISLGLAWLAGAPAGLSTAIAVAVHELPQELGDFMVLRSAGFPVGRLLLWNFLVSLTCVAGVALVHAMGQTASAAKVQRYLTAFTAGSFLSLALNMIFPQVSASIRKHHHGETRSIGLARLLCCILGVVAVAAMVKIGELEAHDHGHDHGHGHGHDHDHGSGMTHADL
mmetsp:Transcript_16635/g.41559  ORF Transcript_16635/g.41559 Transcript_16635/m.41559 type:complete len:439 (-) Transcript_16635:63-1379(-)